MLYASLSSVGMLMLQVVEIEYVLWILSRYIIIYIAVSKSGKGYSYESCYS